MDKMTSKERMLTVIKNQKPDRVPACPDLYYMVPARLTGRPFWDISIHGRIQLWRAYIDTVNYYGIDGLLFYGRIRYFNDSKVKRNKEEVHRDEGEIRVRRFYSTPKGDLTDVVSYPIDNPSRGVEGKIKNFKEDFPKIKYFFPNITGYDGTPLEEQRKVLGDKGIVCLNVGTLPGLHSLMGLFDGGLESLVYAYSDYPDMIEELIDLQHINTLKKAEIAIDCKPDCILFGASGSLTLQNPELWRKYSLPTIKQVTKMAKEAGIPSMLHSCGKQWAILEMVYDETDLNCVNPLEEPPMGDCTLKAAKKSFGDKLCLMGNLHTTEVMLKGTPEDVERAAKKAIDDAAEGGGFILSTGDQCGRDTPDENIFKLVEVAKTYGRY